MSTKPVNSDRCYTPPELAKRWRCDPSTVIGLIKRGALRAFTLSPPTAKRPRWRITAEAIEEFENLHAPDVTAKPPKQRRTKKPRDYIEYV